MGALFLGRYARDDAFVDFPSPGVDAPSVDFVREVYGASWIARFGAVVDFIDVQRLGFFPWIFNIADAGITIGVILILLDSLRRERPA